MEDNDLAADGHSTDHASPSAAEIVARLPEHLRPQVYEIAEHELEARLIARAGFPFEDYNSTLRRAYIARRWRILFLYVGVFDLIILFAAGFLLLSYSGLGEWLLSARSSDDPIHVAIISMSSLGVLFLAAMVLVASFTYAAGGFSRFYSSFREITHRDRSARKVFAKATRKECLILRPAVRAVLNERLTTEPLDNPSPDTLLSTVALSTQIRTRLREAIQAQEGSARLHLVVGLALAFLGIGVATYFSFDWLEHAGDSDGLGEQFWSSLSARILPSLAMQGIWIFFFWSYRRAEAEAKYFQNELTTMESRIYAVRMAYEIGLVDTQPAKWGAEQAQVISALLSQLASTERHIVLKGGEHSLYSGQVQEDGKGILGIFGARAARTD